LVAIDVAARITTEVDQNTLHALLYYCTYRDLYNFLIDIQQRFPDEQFAETAVA